MAKHDAHHAAMPGVPVAHARPEEPVNVWVGEFGEMEKVTFMDSHDAGGERMRAVAIGVDAALIECEARLRAAQLAADVAALDQLISDDLLFTGPDGQLASKAADLEAHRSGAVRFLEHEPDELRARIVNSDAVITSLLARLAVEVSGTVVRGTVRYTRVWAREADGVWRVAGGHVSAVANPGASA
jgi:ketosteroid isomerase-like protein